MRASPPRARWLRGLLWAAVAFAAVVGAAWLAVPPLARWQLESRLSAALARPTTVGSVAFNPFRLQLTVRKLSVAQQGSKGALLSVDEVIANVSSASLWRRAPVLDSLKIVHPVLALARDARGRYSIQDLIDAALAGPPGPPRFSLNNIEVDDGAISFDDGVNRRRHELAHLDIGIPFLSTLPYQTDVRVTPRLSGTFNGTRFALTGTTTPFATHREAALDVELDALPLPQYVAYFPVELPFDLARGALTARIRVVFAGGGTGTQRLELRGEARVDDLALKRADGSALAAARRVAVTLDEVDLRANDARIASLAIDAPAVDIQRLADGTYEWARLLPGRRAPSSAAVGGAPAWTVTIGRFAAGGGALTLRDATSGFQSDLAEVALEASNLSNRAGSTAHFKAAFVSSDRVASFAAEGDVEPTVPSASGHFALKGFSLGLLFPYYRSALAVDVQKGALDYASGFTLDAAGNLRLAGGEATLRELRLALPGSREPLWRIPRLDLSAVDVDVPARTVTLGNARSSGAALRVVRESDGTLEMARIFRASSSTGAAPADGAPPRGPAAGGAGAAPGAPSAPATETWTLLARNLALDGIAIDFEDRVPRRPVKLALRDVAVAATGLTNARDANAEITLRGALGARGRWSFAGSVATNPIALTGALTATDLALAPLDPYVEAWTSIVVTDGALAAKGRLAIALPEHGPASVAWKGDVTVSDFAAVDKPTANDLARWKSLALEGLDAQSAPFKAAVDRIAFDDFDVRATISSDGTLNFEQLLAPEAHAQGAAAAKPAASGERAPPAEPPVSIGRIDLASGRLDFTDRYIKPNYATRLTDVHGSVTEMAPGKPGHVMLAGRMQSTSPVEIEGTLDPFARPLSLDLTGKARDIDLPLLTAYSAKYAGYGIEKGKLRFDVHYRVANGKLSADNRIVLDQLKFGAKVDSPSATKLPVLLAVSLLQDAHGVIDVDLPISGSLDDPDFSLGGVIVKAIVNLIGKAATAPFALLGAAFGGGRELSRIEFAAGSAALRGDANEKIDALARALADRPALKLDIRGRSDPTVDREALRDAAVEEALRRAKLKALAAAGEAPTSLDDVVIGAEERAQWVAQAYRDANPSAPAPNGAGATGTLSPAQMEAALRASAEVDDAALRKLADARAQAVEDALAGKGVAPDRLFLVASRIGVKGSGAAEPGSHGATALTRVDLALRGF